MKRKRSPETEEGTPSGTQSTALDQLIAERKQEKRKALNEELQRKLRIIRDQRTSGGNNEQFPMGSFERLKSNDILGNVLEYLTDPTDVTDASLACRTFAEILRKRRIHKMLPKVLNVFKRKVDEAYEIKDRETGNLCYQNWSTICLRAREVCKAWKHTIGFHSDIAHEEWLKTTDWTIQNDYRTNVFPIEDAESVDKATSLISRGLTFSVSPIRDVFLVVHDRISEPFNRKSKDYFRAHGASVRFLNIHYESRGNESLYEILKYMGNMKTLCVFFYDDNNDDEDDIEEDEIEMLELGGAFQDNQQGINVYPLPALESLEHFSCYDWHRRESVVTQILRKCVNLKSVELRYTQPAEEETTEALMSLTLERFEGLHSIITSNHANWPLKYLKLFPGGDSEMYASVVFPAIHRFRETLEELHIWGRMIMDAGVRTVRLELPHLKTFAVSFIHRDTLGFDDLLPLKSLENIIVYATRSVEYENRNAFVKVKTYLESEEMHKSNVWQCFPNLMRFQIQYSHTYCRPTSPP